METLAVAERSRPVGIGLFLVGVVALAFTFYTLQDDGTFYPKLLVVGTTATGAGVYGAAVGWAQQFRGQPLWWQVGAWLASIASAGVGFALWYVLTNGF